MRKSGPISLFEQDPRHVELLLEHLELAETNVKGVGTPDEKSETYHDETDFEKSKVTLYRSCVMRFANFRADLPHAQFCANRLARGMHKPTIRHWSRLKRVARYLRTHGRCIHQHRCREPTSLLDTFADADWTSDKTDQTFFLVCRIRCQIVTQSAPVLFSVEA